MMINLNLNPPIPALPKADDKTLIDVRYSLIAPYANVHIHWDTKEGELIYEVEEPLLQPQEKESLSSIESAMLELVNINVLVDKTQESMIEYIDKTARLLIHELNLKITEESYERIFYYLYRDFIGFNQIDPLMKDYFIEDIECNGVSTPVYIVHRIYRNIRTNLVFDNIDLLASFVEKLAQRCGRYISYAQPLLDGSLPDGSRVNATYTKDVTSRGPTFTLRKFTKVPWTPTQLLGMNTLSPEMLAYFWMLLQYKANILIAGGTSSGKTTLLNALAFFIPPEARVISIEDTRELNLPRENWLPAVARTSIGIGKVGEVDLFDLLKNSFRQNPDYVIVGEVRGKEAFVLFQGMASIPGDEKILVLNSSKRKMMPIEKIDKNKCRIICVNPETNKTEIKEFESLIKHPSRDELFKIKTKTGREIMVTGDHSLFTYENGIIPIEAKNLKENNVIVIPSRLPSGYSDTNYINLIDYLTDVRIFAPLYIRKAVKILGYDKASELIGVKSLSDYYSNFKRALPSSLKAEKFKLLMENAKIENYLDDIKIKYLKKSKSHSAKLELTPEFLRFLGYYISEGSLNKSGRNSRIALYAKDNETIKDMAKCIESLGCKPKRRITKGFGTATELSFSHKVLFEFLLEHCGKGSANKKIPNLIFGLSKDKLGEFLTGLYIGDGGISKDVISYYTTSKQLVNDLMYLLLEFGIVSRIVERKKSKIGKLDNYEVKIYRVEDKMTFLEYVKIAKREFIEEISKIKGKINPNKKDDIYLDKISSIEKIKLPEPIPVYDISVPGRQNFIGGFGGVMLHNSGHPSVSTLHADSLDTVIRRLQTPPINLSPTLVNSLDCVIVMTHALRNNKHTRRLKEVVEVVNIEKDGTALINTPFVWNPAQDIFYYKKQSKVFEKISSRFGIPIPKLQEEMLRRAKLLYTLYQKRIFGFNEMRKIVNDYYRDPSAVLKSYAIS